MGQQTQAWVLTVGEYPEDTEILAVVLGSVKQASAKANELTAVRRREGNHPVNMIDVWVCPADLYDLR